MKVYLLTKETFKENENPHNVTFKIFAKEETAKQFLRDEIAEGKRKFDKIEFVVQNECCALFYGYKSSVKETVALCYTEQFIIE